MKDALTIATIGALLLFYAACISLLFIPL